MSRIHFPRWAPSGKLQNNWAAAISGTLEAALEEAKALAHRLLGDL